MNSTLIKYNETLIQEIKNDKSIEKIDKEIMEEMLNFVLTHPGNVTKDDFEKIVEGKLE